MSGIAATLAHIHQGYAGATGPVIVNFVQSGADPNRWDAQAGSTLTADQVNEPLPGRLYVNVHSSTNTNGEIRGQIEEQVTNPGSYCTAKPNSQACTPAVGWTSLPSLTGTDDYVVSATNVINNKNAVFVWSQIPANLPFNGGTLCVDQATAVITAAQNSGGNPQSGGDDCSGTLSFAASAGLAWLRGR